MAAALLAASAANGLLAARRAGQLFDHVVPAPVQLITAAAGVIGLQALGALAAGLRMQGWRMPLVPKFLALNLYLFCPISAVQVGLQCFELTLLPVLLYRIPRMNIRQMTLGLIHSFIRQKPAPPPPPPHPPLAP